ncbi:MAG: SH3 domain-containing protein [Bdellovibrionales bacterium]
MSIFRLLLLTVGIWSTVALGQEPAPRSPTPEELFSEGTKLYQEGKFTDSAKKFEALARQQPDKPELLLNWGLAEYQSGRRGMGVALWRRALAISPSHMEARRALDFATRAMQLREVEDSLWLERVRHDVLAHVALDQMLTVTLLLLATGGWLLLGYAGRRRKAMRQDLPLPPFSWAGTLLGVGFVFALGLTVLKAVEWSIPRATAVTITSVRTGPDNASSSLFELREGSDVILRQAKKGWTQIRYPGGMSGWVPNETLFQTSGMPLW